MIQADQFIKSVIESVQTLPEQTDDFFVLSKADIKLYFSYGDSFSCLIENLPALRPAKFELHKSPLCTLVKLNSELSKLAENCNNF